MRSLVIMLCATLIGGCVSNSDDPCEKVWSDVGEGDGKLGFAAARIHRALFADHPDQHLQPLLTIGFIAAAHRNDMRPQPQALRRVRKSRER